MEKTSPQITLVASTETPKWTRAIAVARALLPHSFHLIDLNSYPSIPDKNNFDPAHLFILVDDISEKWFTQKASFETFSTIRVFSVQHLMQALLDWEAMIHRNQIPLNWGYHLLADKNCNWNELKLHFNELLLIRMRTLIEPLNKVMNAVDPKNLFQTSCKIYCDGTDLFFEITLPDQVRTLISRRNKRIEIPGAHLTWISHKDCVMLVGRMSVVSAHSLENSACGYSMMLDRSNVNVVSKRSKQEKAG